MFRFRSPPRSDDKRQSVAPRADTRHTLWVDHPLGLCQNSTNLPTTVANERSPPTPQIFPQEHKKVGSWKPRNRKKCLSKDTAESGALKRELTVLKGKKTEKKRVFLLHRFWCRCYGPNSRLPETQILGACPRPNSGPSERGLSLCFLPIEAKNPS